MSSFERRGSSSSLVSELSCSDAETPRGNSQKNGGGGEPRPKEWATQQKEVMRARRIPPNMDEVKAAIRQVTKLAELKRAEHEIPMTQPLTSSDLQPFDIGREDAIIIFDWDDTLFPTSFLQEEVVPSLRPQDRKEPLADDSPFRERFAAHGTHIRATLVAARRVAHVAIVTLALRPWVYTSCERYLDGFDIGALLKGLDIPIFYAREHMKKPDAFRARVEEGVDPYTVAKRRAMLKALKKLRSKMKTSSLNVISVGDAITEKEALQEVLWSLSEHQVEGAVEDGLSSLCKTVKLADNPSVNYLSDQLQLIQAWLPRMAALNEDFDFFMDDPEDLTTWSQAYDPGKD